MTKNVTIFCDIDGTILFHAESGLYAQFDLNISILNGAADKLRKWQELGYYIVLTTARPSSLRKETEKQLFRLKITYNVLLMDCTSGPRYLINDRKSDGSDSAFGITVPRNVGIINLNI